MAAPEPVERETTVLAWAGWRMRIPGDWRPYGITGTQTQGTLLVGDAERALAQVKWWRPKRALARFDAESWMRKRLRRTMPRGCRSSAFVAPADFTHVVWLPDRPGTEPSGKHVWYGYAERAHLVLEVVVNARGDPGLSADAAAALAASLAVSGIDEPTRWSVFSASFASPAGFDIVERKMQLGDLSLCFSAPGGRRLLLRQVYPATTALGRRTLERWLAAAPFPERRRFRARGEAKPWQLDAGGRTLAGILRRGTKRYALPLGCIAARHSLAGAVRDTDLDRLLLAEYDAPDAPDEQPVAAALCAMNWAQREPGAAP